MWPLFYVQFPIARVTTTSRNAHLRTKPIAKQFCNSYKKTTNSNTNSNWNTSNLINIFHSTRPNEDIQQKIYKQNCHSIQRRKNQFKSPHQIPSKVHTCYLPRARWNVSSTNLFTYGKFVTQEETFIDDLLFLKAFDLPLMDWLWFRIPKLVDFFLILSFPGKRATFPVL